MYLQPGDTKIGSQGSIRSVQSGDSSLEPRKKMYVRVADDPADRGIRCLCRQVILQNLTGNSYMSV